MYVDIPTFKRCCCCIPLRFGLVAWGYLKLTVIILLLCLMDFEKIENGYHIFVYVFSSVDITFNVMFVVGAHLKNCSILKIYFYYSIVVLIVYLALDIGNLAYFIYYANFLENHIGTFSTVVLIGGSLALEILEIIVQAYLTLLVRSEVFKLENNIQFKFVTVTGEAACTSGTGDKEMTEEKVKYDQLKNEEWPTLIV